MTCPKCGSIIPAHNKFCSICGEKLTNSVSDNNTKEINAEANTQYSETSSISSPEKKHVKFIPRKIFPIAASVLLAVFLIIGASSIISSLGGSNVYAYLSDGKYYLISDLDKSKSVEIASAKSDSIKKNMLAFSPDGKYIYYYTKYDSLYDTGTLCRAEYSKLKENSSKNEKHIDIISTNVSLGFKFSKDGSLLFTNSDGTLFYYDGKEVARIANNITEFFVENGTNRVIYHTGDYTEGYSLYGVVIDDIDNKVELASDYYEILSFSDYDHILYTTREDDGSHTLYSVGFNRPAEKLAKNLAEQDILNGKLFFTVENGNSISLYDYVVDESKNIDNGIAEPDSSQFSIPKYSYEMISGSDLNESDYSELYTSCTQPLYWFGMSYWGYSMEDMLAMDLGDGNDGLFNILFNFIVDHGDKADENGYIKVTDEIKEDLKEIQKFADSPEKEWQWLWLCCTKKQAGTTTDYDAYNAAYDKWKEAENRVLMREQLKNPENAYPLYTLYCYDKGTLTTLDETVLDIIFCQGAVLYNTKELVTDKLPFDEVSSCNDINKLFSLEGSLNEKKVILSDGTSCKMPLGSAETYISALNSESGSSADLFFADKEVYLSEDNGTLSVANIKNGIIEEFTIISDDAVFLGIYNSSFYYAADIYSAGSNVFCNMYSSTGGKPRCIAKDIILNRISLYDDGTILAYSDKDSYSGYELSMFSPNGDVVVIGENVTHYIRIDKAKYLYISDGDLFCFNGKESKLIQSNVAWVWSQNMDIARIFATEDMFDYYGYYDVLESLLDYLG